MAILLALDTSTKNTGYAVYKDCKLSRYDQIHATDKDSTKRMIEMVNEIYTVMKKENPDIVIIETPSVVRNPKTQRELTMVVGAVLGKCAEKNIFYNEMRPTEWRKLVKSEDEKLPRKREELKAWAVDTVKINYDIDVNDDIADAILLGQAYINRFV